MKGDGKIADVTIRQIRDGCLCAIYRFEHAVGLLKENPTLVGQDEFFGIVLEQLRPEFLLELFDLNRYGGDGHATQVGCATEAFIPSDNAKGIELLQVHEVPPTAN